MAKINPPAPLPLRNAKWRNHVMAQVNRSGWTGKRKVVGLPGADFRSVTADFTTRIGEGDAAPWRAFFGALEGPVNTFPVRAGEAVQTSVANPTVRAGANDGITLPLAGLPVSVTVLRAGYGLTVPLPSGHERLVWLRADLVSDGAGNGTAVFDFELGEIPAAGAVVEIGRPWCLMALTSDPPGWDVDPGQVYAFSISAEEAL